MTRGRAADGSPHRKRRGRLSSWTLKRHPRTKTSTNCAWFSRSEAYLADITYGTNSEFGFDYLRDNTDHAHGMTASSAGIIIAIVDEVDNILIDEARTPLIISGPAAEECRMVHQRMAAGGPPAQPGRL